MGRKWLYLLILIIAFIILPTGTPEDLLTTAVLIYFLGIWKYALLALITLLLVLLLLPKRYRRLCL